MSKTIKVIIKNDIHPVNFKLKYNFLFHRVNVSTIRGGWQHSHLDQPIKSGTTYRNNIKALCSSAKYPWSPEFCAHGWEQGQCHSHSPGPGHLCTDIGAAHVVCSHRKCLHSMDELYDIGEIKSPPLNFQ